MEFSRHVTINWTGSVLEGSGMVTADKGDAGIKITTSALSLVAEGVTGMDAATFTEVAKEAEQKCPVSNAYRGSMKVTLDTTVK